MNTEYSEENNYGEREREQPASNDDAFFTIVIPTRERSDTLVHTIACALAQEYKNFEVLVSDNDSKDLTGEKVRAINDERLRYINTERRVSMSENWEFAIDHVSDGWVTVLGDDDGILPGALDYVNRIIKSTGTKAIRSNVVQYKWPSLTGLPFGELDVSLKRGFESRQSDRLLQQVIDGVTPYTELPVLYNGGFISTELIKEAKKITGTFFNSMTPDVYSAIVFSLLTKEYIYCHEPLAINGASIHSGGTAAFEGAKKRKRTYDPAEKYLNENTISFHESLPTLGSGRPVRSIPVLVYEAFLQARAFHELSEVSTSHSKQLRIALKNPGPHKEEVIEWARAFAKRHRLKFPEPLSGKSRTKTTLLIKIRQKIRDRLFNIHITGSNSLPLRDVNEASVIVGCLKVFRPSLSRRIARRIKGFSQLNMIRG